MIDKSIISVLAKDLQIDQYSVYREYLQIAFLNTLYSELASKEIFFKGGTALRFIYSSKRFSEDLDFNSSMNKNEVKNLLSKARDSLSYEIPNIRLKDLDSLAGYSAKLYMNIDLTNQPLTVKLDFSFREKVESFTERLIQTKFPVQSYSLVGCLSKEEILAEKIRTLYTRFKGRDIYDLWYLLHTGTSLNEDLINKKLRRINKKYDREVLIEKIKKFSDGKLKRDLNKFLPLPERPIIRKLKDLILEKI